MQQCANIMWTTFGRPQGQAGAQMPVCICGQAICRQRHRQRTPFAALTAQPQQYEKPAENNGMNQFAFAFAAIALLP